MTERETCGGDAVTERETCGGDAVTERETSGGEAVTERETCGGDAATMRNGGALRTAIATAAAGLLVSALAACGGGAGPSTDAGHPADPGGTAPSAGATADARGPADPTRVPDVGDRYQRRIPAASRQVVAVYGDGRNSPDSTVVLYTKRGSRWHESRRWPAHNGAKGWTTDHHENDKRSPVGVFTLSDAGGVLPDPGAELPYTRSPSFAAPRWWDESYWHDFDYVIAIDYNRVKGTPPNDPTRPRARPRAAASGCTWTTAAAPRRASACRSGRWSTCCARSTRTFTPWWSWGTGRN